MRRCAIAILGYKLLNGLPGRFQIAERHFERRFQIEQRGSARMRRKSLLHVPQRGARLLAFDHAVNFSISPTRSVQQNFSFLPLPQGHIA